MTSATQRLVRCAIYTRVSDDQGLEQDFNSLDAQYDASQSYIRSQAHAGWTLISGKYADGGFTGGDIDRPALQRLLDDVRSGKVDRLTRSLADFAKLVELFDQHNVSFVSVTQQFNTTTSMGRLTLNILLSFAQFEREVTSERIRDKITASKRKGLWVGGMVPLGYDAKDRKIWVNEEEAERVRVIFRRYLELGSLATLLGDLRQQGIVTKLRILKTGETVGGVPFTRGGMSYLLRNRFYLGEVAFKGEVLPGEQLAILDRELFDAVQVKLSEQKNNHKTLRTSSNALLMGRLFDDRGNGMTPSHTCKQGVRYRYYLSSGLLQGQAERPGSVRRVAATEIENVVIQTVRDHVKPPEAVDDRGLVEAYVERVEIRPDRLIVRLNQTEAADGSQPEGTNTLHIPWSKTPPTKRREILLLPADPSQQRPRPIRSETKATLIAAIAQERLWLKELIEDPAATTESIASGAQCSVRKVNMTISLAFLAPNLVKAAIDGHLPHGLGIARLCDLPIEWARQHQTLGLAAY